MNRVFVVDEYGSVRGRFDADKARVFGEVTDFDGRNRVSMNTQRPELHQELLLTAGGRWVLNEWSQVAGAAPRFSYLTAAEAREWLIRNSAGDATVEELFGSPVEDETGPEIPEYNTGGRPSIGGRVNVALGDLLTSVDAYAEAERIARAEAIRRLVLNGLRNRPAPAPRCAEALAIEQGHPYPFEIREAVEDPCGLCGEPRYRQESPTGGPSRHVHLGAAADACPPRD